MQINRQVSKNTVNRVTDTLSLCTYLSYIIPICCDYAVTRIGIREVFDSLDKNLDGKITCTELISLLYNVNQNLTPNEIIEYTAKIKKICSIADKDGDGYISYDEFKTFMINGGLTLNK